MLLCELRDPAICFAGDSGAIGRLTVDAEQTCGQQIMVDLKGSRLSFVSSFWYAHDHNAFRTTILGPHRTVAMLYGGHTVWINVVIHYGVTVSVMCVFVISIMKLLLFVQTAKVEYIVNEVCMLTFTRDIVTALSGLSRGALDIYQFCRHHLICVLSLDQLDIFDETAEDMSSSSAAAAALTSTARKGKRTTEPSSEKSANKKRSASNATQSKKRKKMSDSDNNDDSDSDDGDDGVSSTSVDEETDDSDDDDDSASAAAVSSNKRQRKSQSAAKKVKISTVTQRKRVSTKSKAKGKGKAVQSKKKS